MASFLSQDEIDALLDIIEHIDLPFFAYVKTPSGNYDIIEINESNALEIVGKLKEITDADVIGSLQQQGYAVKATSQKKGELVKELHKRYADLLDAKNQVDFLKEYLNAHPEYVI